MEEKKLFEEALKARELSYSPYSNFKVGAVIETKDGKVFKGANVENCSYSLTMCAERNAIYNAMMNGYSKKDFISLTLVADTDEPCSPCGACRQVISELLDENTPIYLFNLKGDLKKILVNELLPFAFKQKDLK